MWAGSWFKTELRLKTLTQEACSLLLPPARAVHWLGAPLSTPPLLLQGGLQAYFLMPHLCSPPKKASLEQEVKHPHSWDHKPRFCLRKALVKGISGPREQQRVIFSG